MRYTSFFIALLPFLFSCDSMPDDICSNCPEPNDTIQTSKLKVLWQIPLNPDTMDCSSMKPVIYNGNVLYSLLFYNDGFEPLRMVDGKTGQPVWSWDPLWPGETLWRPSRFVKDNLFVLTHWGPTYCIDLNTGNNIWANNVQVGNSVGSPNLSNVGDYIYTEHSDRQTLDTASYFVRANIHDGIWDTLFVLKIDDGYRPDLLPPSLWMSPQGDSILIFQNRQWNFAASDGRLDLLAYNLRTRTFEWKVKDFDLVGNSNLIPPFIHENKVYLQAQQTLYCFDAASGQQLWTWGVPLAWDNLMQTNLIVAEGKLFVKPNNEKALYALNPNSGQQLFKIPDAGSGQGHMVYHNGIIYYSSVGNGKICAVRPSNQQVIWNEYSPNRDTPGKWKNLTAFDDLTISPELNCLFVSDHYFFMAIQLPE